MNPFDRWDEWEWERAAHEMGKDADNRIKYEGNPGRPGYYFSEKDYQKNIMDRFSGSQKRVALAALCFLTIVFSSQGEDIASQAVYNLYRLGMDNGNAYTALNSMARDAIGLNPEPDAIAVDGETHGNFFPPVAGVVRVGFKGLGYNEIASRGIEIESHLGTPVLAPEEGVITEIYEDKILGRTVAINFGDGWECLLANLGQVSVRQGQPVAMGTEIGLVGLSSVRDKPWLYFELIKDGEPVNPIPYLIQNE